MVDGGAMIDHMVSDILDDMRPKLADALRAAFERGQQVSDARYADKIAQAYSLLSELRHHTPDSGETDIPTGTYWLTKRGDERRAALGTVKPRVLELISRAVGASIPEIEAIGIKPNSIRGTLYALQKDGHIQRRGDRWYVATPESNETPSNTDEVSQG